MNASRRNSRRQNSHKTSPENRVPIIENARFFICSGGNGENQPSICLRVTIRWLECLKLSSPKIPDVSSPLQTAEARTRRHQGLEGSRKLSGFFPASSFGTLPVGASSWSSAATEGLPNRILDRILEVIDFFSRDRSRNLCKRVSPWASFAPPVSLVSGSRGSS